LVNFILGKAGSTPFSPKINKDYPFFKMLFPIHKIDVDESLVFHSGGKGIQTLKCFGLKIKLAMNFD
jgi:hypothetical protein